MRRLALLAAVLLAGGPVLAEEPGACARFKWPVERERLAFAAESLPRIESGGTLPGPAAPALVALRPQAGVAFEHPPGRKPKMDDAFAAVLKLPSLAAGTYQVTLSGEAWIDMLQDGREVRSAGFSGQPDCPGVRKSVKFPLKAGPATLQISGAAADSIKVDVLPAEQ